ncbi:phosphoribosylanthranilate isomerase [Tenacibaculum sp. MAR_2009_124]|uniref:phosphoribosylanthranilate isomerase n=1 Tax=Tenacibaculum sp. MAR_2009_124 TaxID=1250059 RepID=UPI000896A45A|nr:phosphoribosylanthranilate isomerase [Tenacibaculum sp. MAR_2009_124]SEC84095.1 phosphoribosylanthranilate isomerase [Tenacibaculum sp. MAR_2009_124]
MKLKICGMKYIENIKQVADLKPDYLGFIFYEKSKRNFEGIIPEIPKSIKKVGVFVNEYLEIVVSLAQEYQLSMLQLHGDESPEYIKELKDHLPNVEMIKVFGIRDSFDFDKLKPFEGKADYFLFDTKGKERGGNGVTFDWKLLEKYNSNTPYFLSGGIGLEEINSVKEFMRTSYAKQCIALDVNSRFETEPGKKSIKKLKKFTTIFIK